MDGYCTPIVMVISGLKFHPLVLWCWLVVHYLLYLVFMHVIGNRSWQHVNTMSCIVVYTWFGVKGSWLWSRAPSMYCMSGLCLAIMLVLCYWCSLLIKVWRFQIEPSCVAERIWNWVCHMYVWGLEGSWSLVASSFANLSVISLPIIWCAHWLFVWSIFVLCQICLVWWFVLVICMGDCCEDGCLMWMLYMLLTLSMKM